MKVKMWRTDVVEPWIHLITFYIDEEIIYLSVSVPSLCIEATPYKIKEDKLKDWVMKKGYLKQTEYDMKTGKYLNYEIEWKDYKELHLTMPILERFLNE